MNDGDLIKGTNLDSEVNLNSSGSSHTSTSSPTYITNKFVSFNLDKAAR